MQWDTYYETAIFFERFVDDVTVLSQCYGGYSPEGADINILFKKCNTF